MSKIGVKALVSFFKSRFRLWCFCVKFAQSFHLGILFLLRHQLHLLHLLSCDYLMLSACVLPLICPSALLTQVLVWLFGVCFEDYRFYIYIYIFILFIFIVSFSVSLSVLFTAHCSVFLVNSCWDKNISQCSTHNTPLLMQAISETVPVLCQCWLILSCALCPQYVFQILCSNQ